MVAAGEGIYRGANARGTPISFRTRNVRGEAYAEFWTPIWPHTAYHVLPSQLDAVVLGKGAKFGTEISVRSCQKTVQVSRQLSGIERQNHRLDRAD